jgi:DNA-binding MarR family transcriptional regulator
MDEPLTDLACACATSRQVARLLTQLYDRRLKRIGMEAPQFALLVTLDKQGPCSQTTLGRRYGLDKTTVSRNLRWLEQRGWVERSTGDDKRQRRFALTDAGRRQLAIARPQWKKAQEQLRSSMTVREWDEMFTVFRTVAAAAQRLQSE